MGNAYKPMAVSFQCMTKSITIKKKNKIKQKKKSLVTKQNLRWLNGNINKSTYGVNGCWSEVEVSRLNIEVPMRETEGLLKSMDICRFFLSNNIIFQWHIST